MEYINGPTRLRRLHPDDLEPFLTYRADPVVGLYQSWDKLDHAQALGFLQHMARGDPLLRPGHWTQIAIAQTQDDSLIGDMGWHLSDDSSEVEIGITLARTAQGQGHATRAVAMAVAHIFAQPKVDRIVAFVDLRNLPSRALMTRSGFNSLGEQIYEGIREEAFELRRDRAS